MSTDNTLEPPESDWRDNAHLATKTVLSPIPAASELFNWIVLPPLEKRREAWRKRVAERLEQLAKEVESLKIDKLGDNPVFVSTIMQASVIAMRTHQEEKLTALSNAVLNASLPSRPVDDLQVVFLNHIDTISEGHLLLLAFLADPKLVMTERGTIDQVRPRHETARTYFLMTYPDWKDQWHFLVYLINDLVSRGLVNDHYWHNEGGPETLFAGLLWPLGTQFMEFIQDPQLSVEKELK